MYHHVEQQDSDEVKKILEALVRIERNTVTSVGNEAELLTKIEAANATTTKVGEEIKRILAAEANLSPETMARMDALANGLIGLDVLIPDTVVVPDEEPPTDEENPPA